MKLGDFVNELLDAGKPLKAKVPTQCLGFSLGSGSGCRHRWARHGPNGCEFKLAGGVKCPCMRRPCDTCHLEVFPMTPNDLRIDHRIEYMSDVDARMGRNRQVRDMGMRLYHAGECANAAAPPRTWTQLVPHMGCNVVGCCAPPPLVRVRR